jgi:hypothetical protein
MVLYSKVSLEEIPIESLDREIQSLRLQCSSGYPVFLNMVWCDPLSVSNACTESLMIVPSSFRIHYVVFTCLKPLDTAELQSKICSN